MKRKETKSDLTRRDFIKTTAVGVGATALAGLSAKEAGSLLPSTRSRLPHSTLLGLHLTCTIRPVVS
ncbi:MAG: twin-arginine translocation signal domain-containing protein [Acidobacteria bacterium]|nr:twin-arginine translocation signal domain-containing protein [Acidobacteriota bacterium]